MKPPRTGRLLFPALRWSAATGYAHEEPRIEDALRRGAGGFCIFGGTVEGVRELTHRTQSRCDHALLFGSDLERGAGQQFAGAAALPPLGAIGALDDAAASRRAGELTASEACRLGVNWVFAPSADLDLEPSNPIVGTRAFGRDAEAVSRHVHAWIGGCHAGGALACAKHFPGHGRTTEDSHARLPTVRSSRAELELDLAPFRAAVAAGVDAIMTAHVVFSALDPHAPATLSAPILEGLLRDTLGFEGLIVTDALIMQALLDAIGGDEAAASVAAVGAGCDGILYPGDLAAVADALAGAYGAQLPRARVDAALERMAHAAERSPARWESLDASADAWARELALRCVTRLSGRPACPPRLELLTVDDDLGGPYPPPTREPFERALHEHGIAVEPVSAPTGAPLLVAVYSDIRAWKERPGLSASAYAAVRAALVRRGDATVVLFGHPRVAAQIGGENVVVAWGGESVMQRAAAAWLASNAARTVL